MTDSEGAPEYEAIPEVRAEPLSEEAAIRVCLRYGVFVPERQLREAIYGAIVTHTDEEFVSASVIRPGDRVRLREVTHFLDGVPELPDGVDFVEVWNIEWGNPFTIDHPYGSVTVPENFPVIRIHEYTADVRQADAGVDFTAAIERGSLSGAEAIGAARQLLHTMPEGASGVYAGLSRFARTGIISDEAHVLAELKELPRTDRVEPLRILLIRYVRQLS